MLVLIERGGILYKQIVETIKQAQKVILIPHVRPDGDCLGSSFGLKYAIEENFGIEAHVVGEHSKDSNWMGDISELSDSDFADALVISLDTGSKDRMIDSRGELGKFFIRIDHHPHVDYFGDIDHVDSSMASCCSIVTDMIRTSGLKLNDLAAKCLFFGTVTDTGRFKYPSVTSLTHINAAFLLEYNVDIQDVFDRIYLKDITRLNLDKFVLNNLQSTESGFLYVSITVADMKALKINKDDAGNAISKLENIEGYPVWAVFYELDGEIRGRLRSRGPSINGLAAKYRGGGHALASGLTLHSWDELDSFKTDLDVILKK